MNFIPNVCKVHQLAVLDQTCAVHTAHFKKDPADHTPIFLHVKRKRPPVAKRRDALAQT